MLHQCSNIFGSCDLCQKRSISLLIYGNIRDLVYFTYKFDIIFGGHFDFFFQNVVSISFQYSEHIHYLGFCRIILSIFIIIDYVETRVSNLKFIKYIKFIKD